MSTGGTPLVVRHLLICQEVQYDFDNALAPYSLHNITSVLATDEGFPFLFELLWVFVQGAGDPGEYDIWIDLVRIDEDGEAIDDEMTFGPWVWILKEDQYIQSRAWRLRLLPFREAGLYEIRLRCGFDILAREELLLEE